MPLLPRLAILLSAALLPAAFGAPMSVDDLAVTLKPLVGGDGAVSGIAVTERIERRGTPTPFSLVAPIGQPGVPRIAGAVADLTVTDEMGDVAMAPRDAADAQGQPVRTWRPDRPTGQHITVRYTMPVTATAQGGPPYAIKSAGGGVAGNMLSVFVVPQGIASTRTLIAWDVSALPRGSIGVVSDGEGAVAIDGPPDAVAERWLLAGPAKGLSRSAGDFHTWLLGTPPIDGAALLAWSARAYAVLADSYGYLGSPPYELLIRTLPGASFATGTAGPRSALITMGTSFLPAQGPGDVYETIFHEMAHQWDGQLTPSSSWFGEGLTVFVTATLPCRARLLPAANCAAMIARWAHDYYTSPGRLWSRARIEAAPFDREDIRRVPYGRGMLYFAEVDAAIRARSNGRRDLIAALRPVFAAREKGTPMTEATWEALLRQELGPGAVADFRRTIILGSRPPAPPSGAFGRCLERTPTRWSEKGRASAGFVWTVRPDAGAECAASPA